ncbi:MAG: NADPH-dependent assimilatory sulfite reductase hemoprotein subunit [Pirellulales bacterium]
MADDKGPSAAELAKINSNYLRGTIADDLKNDSDQFDKDNGLLLKFHGTYQQDDRDARGGEGKVYSMMTRTRIPGGKLTAAQLIAHLDLCDELGNATLKCTTRQALQLHCIPKGKIREAINRINKIQLSTIAACGDVNRNIMCCPAPYKDGIRSEMQKLADDLAQHLEPRTKAYYELWVKDLDSGEETLAGGGPGPDDEQEPIYGKTYLPRKFKTAIALPDDNCVDLYTNDLGFIAVIRDDKIIGYNVTVGGGLGMTPSAKKTFPALAKRLAFITPDQACGVAEAIIKVQRDNGNRSDRKVARMKYLIADKGMEWFRAEVEKYYGSALKDCTEDDVRNFNDHMGWDEQGDGLWFYGWNVENGRLYDSEDRRWKTAIREICAELNPGVRLTAHQSILFTDIAPENRSKLEEIIRRNGLPLSEEISTVRRWSMACVALPTCGLAVTESERALPGVIDHMEKELERLGLDKEKFTVRMTGCPNGCARPYNAEIGLVGKTKGKYTLYVGGKLLGTRLAFVHKDLVATEDIVPTLVPLFTAFKDQRSGNESFGDFCARLGNEKLLEIGAAQSV